MKPKRISVAERFCRQSLPRKPVDLLTVCGALSSTMVL